MNNIGLQEQINMFISEKIIYTDDPDYCIKRASIVLCFKKWYHLATGNMPTNLNEIHAAFQQEFGQYEPGRWWKNLKFRDELDEIEYS